jgi:hypothetical protein
VLAGNPAQTLLVLPLNVTAVMAPKLRSASPAVWNELTAYLQDQGKQLKTVNAQVARQLWLGSIRKARAGEKGAQAGFGEAAAVFVSELAQHAEFDAVISPSLFVREAEIAGRQASWDGVSRPLEFDAYSLEAKTVGPNASFEGRCPAASLDVVVLDAEGAILQENLRGLQLLVRVRVREPRPDLPPDRLVEYVERPDLFSDRDSLRADIAEALAPYLPPPRTGAP